MNQQEPRRSIQIRMYVTMFLIASDSIHIRRQEE